MIYILITAYKEPKSTLKAANAILKQKTDQPFKLIVTDPFMEVEEFLLNNIEDERFEFILDPGEGKTNAMNMILEQYYSDNQEDIFIFTDGDVYTSENSIQAIIDQFKDSKVGCVTGRPIPIDSKDKKFGYWAHVLYDAIHNLRVKLNTEKSFFQSTGYLFALRNGIINEIPIDVPEDAIVPYLVWKKGFRNAYADNAKVYVKYPDNWEDWVNQRIRTIKAHENINPLAPDMPRTKSFLNEIKGGAFFVLAQPRNLKQFAWTIQLFLARLYIYYRSFREIKKEEVYDPGWRDTEIKSTSLLD
jgi:cellulose synthase/poly-beta-1,6-N-acetylglucosamine synthase-like glycosyltransferase